MSKFKKHEIENYFEPNEKRFISEPEKEQIEEKATESIQEQISIILDELLSRGIDIYTDEKNYNPADPDYYYSRLNDLKREYIATIKNYEERKKIQKEITRAEKLVYKQFIPFIESEVYAFGYSNSPLTKRKSYQIYPDEIMALFKRAETSLDNQELSQQEKDEFLIDLNRLKENFENYQSEPTLFTFEQKEEELHNELFTSNIKSYNYGIDDPDRLLENATTLKENLKKIESWLVKTHYLHEIAGKMLTQKIKTQCIERVNYLYLYIENLKNSINPPKNKSRNSSHIETATTNVDWAWLRLDLKKDATFSEIKSRYKELALQYHPDRHDGSTKKMQEINEAYTFLKNYYSHLRGA